MAVKAIEGFDHYASITDVENRATGVIWTTNAFAISSANTRFGYGKCLINGAGATNPVLTAQFTQTYSTGFVGFAIYLSTAGSLAFIDNSTVPNSFNQCSVTLNANGVISIQNAAGTVVASTALGTFTFNAYHFLEIGLAPSSSGTLIVKLDNTTVLNYTGNLKNSNAAASNSFDAMQLSCGTLTVCRVDDFYINDTTVTAGSYPANTFLGDGRVYTQFMNGNNSVTWTPLANTNWQEISETAFDGDVTYNSTATAGNIDRFTPGVLPANATGVVALQLTGAYRKDDAAVHTIAQHIESVATDFTGATWTVLSTYQYYNDMVPLDPNTGGSWTVAAVNASLPAYEMVS